MTHTLTARLSVVAMAAGLVATMVHPMSARQEKKAAAAVNLAGTWNMGLQGDHVIPVGLVLEQDGKKVTGTLMMMGTDVKLEGEFVDGALSLMSTTDVKMGMRGGPPGPNGATAPAAKMKIDGTMREDGTLAGKIVMPNMSLPWIAERLKERPVTSAAAASLAGAWSLVMQMDGAPMSAELAVKQNGTAISGTLTSKHTGEIPIEGTYTGGKLRFTATAGTGGQAAELDYSGKLNADGTLAGQMIGPMGTVSWTAERVKK